MTAAPVAKPVKKSTGSRNKACTESIAAKPIFPVYFPIMTASAVVYSCCSIFPARIGQYKQKKFFAYRTFGKVDVLCGFFHRSPFECLTLAEFFYITENKDYKHNCRQYPADIKTQRFGEAHAFSCVRFGNKFIPAPADFVAAKKQKHH